MKKLIIALASVAILAGCAKTPQQKAASALVEVQAIKTNYIRNDHKVAGLGIGTSTDEQIAYNMADQAARVDVARAVDVQIKAINKQFAEQVDYEGKDAVMQHYQQASKSKIDLHLNGATMTDVKIETTDDGKFKVYGVVVLDVNLVDELIASMKATNEALSEAQIQKVRAVAEKAYKELD
ncbi:MAG: hypothetical protein HUK20_12480 [Fibrobacter sp.]|nr:hypothetical protein [Fibrobacter sp.]